MKNRGFNEEDSRNYSVMGCVELTCPGKTGAMSANALLLCRLLDVTMRNGDSQTMRGKIRNMGLQTGDPDSFESFKEFLEAYYKQAEKQIDIMLDWLDSLGLKKDVAENFSAKKIELIVKTLNAENEKK